MGYTKPETMENYKHRRRANGICNSCGNSARQGSFHCQNCNDKFNQARMLKYNLAKLTNSCTVCYNTPATIGDSCLYCWLRRTAGNATKSREDWSFLFRKLEEQRYKCKYSGKNLIPGDNASIDHIEPTSKGGNNELDNLVWCDLAVNMMKSNLSLKAFLLLCKQIYFHCIKMPEHPDYLKNQKHAKGQQTFDFVYNSYDDEGQLICL